MYSVISIALHTLTENFRNRTYLVSIFFAFVLLAVTMFMGVLGGEQPVRVIVDFGFTTIEFFSVLMVVFTGVSIILDEINNKTIYLVMVRPLPRWRYILGKFFGLIASVYVSMLLMAAMHVVLLLYKGWHFTLQYPVVLFASFIKIAVIGSLAIFFSLFSTSNISSLVFTFFVWILGHFASEIKYLVSKLSLAPKIIMTIVYYLIPNLSLLNWRDYSGSVKPDISFVYGIIYSVLYCACFLLFSMALFKKKEF